VKAEAFALNLDSKSKAQVILSEAKRLSKHTEINMEILYNQTQLIGNMNISI